MQPILVNDTMYAMFVYVRLFRFTMGVLIHLALKLGR